MKSAALRVNDEGHLERNEDALPRQQALTLHITSPHGPMREVLLRSGSVSIGRSEACTLQLQDRKVSRRHAEVLLLDGFWTVLDCGSQNGTYLSGIRLKEPRRLRPGDVLRLGDTTIFVALAPASGTGGACLEPAPASHRQEAPLHVDRPDLCDTTEMLGRPTIDPEEAASGQR
jgi:predicted component of type VI protein secretion system